MKSIPDLVWNEIKILLPKKEHPAGRPEIDNRKALNGIIFILHTGAQWNMLPEKYGNYKTVHGKFIKWCRFGVFQKIMLKAREFYRRRNGSSNWFAFDVMIKKAPFANFAGKNPTDRAKHGIKYSLLTDRKGAPLFFDIAPANVHDSKLFIPVLSHLKKSKNLRIVAADSAFDAQYLYSYCQTKNLALIATPNKRRKKDIHVFKVPHRWVIEQTFGCLSWFRGIKICWSKTIDAALGIAQIAFSLRLFKMSGIFR